MQEKQIKTDTNNNLLFDSHGRLIIINHDYKNRLRNDILTKKVAHNNRNQSENIYDNNVGYYWHQVLNNEQIPLSKRLSYLIQSIYEQPYVKSAEIINQYRIERVLHLTIKIIYINNQSDTLTTEI